MITTSPSTIGGVWFNLKIISSQQKDHTVEDQ